MWRVPFAITCGSSGYTSALHARPNAAGAPLDAADVPATLGRTAQAGKGFQISIALDLLSHVSIFALAGLLYLAFSPYRRPLALLGTLWRVAEGAILALNEVNKLLLLMVAQKVRLRHGIRGDRPGDDRAHPHRGG